jgi:Tfp pilus assembly protein PilN
MMPRLGFDFSRRNGRFAPLGLLLLLVAGAMLLLAADGLWGAWQDDDQAQAELDAVQLRALAGWHHAPPPVTPATRLAQKQSQAVLRELTAPWQELLSIVEGYPGRNVALIGIDQNPGQSQVRITAEAKDFDAMVAYLNYLQHSALLREAVLNGHQIESREPGTPVRFQVAAVWRKP